MPQLSQVVDTAPECQGDVMVFIPQSLDGVNGLQQGEAQESGVVCSESQSSLAETVCVPSAEKGY